MARLSTKVSFLLQAGTLSMALAVNPLPTQASETNGNAPPLIYGRTLQESPPPSWPQEPRAPKGAPNVIVIMTDDVGFGATDSFGGAIPTPVFDALGKDGLRYNNFNTTAICSPTRASLLTGRDPQAVGVGYVTNWATGYPGYNSVIPKSAVTVAQILKMNGYNTAMFGKGHITPEWEMSETGPFDRWPTGLGFEYFYGFLGADSSMFEPSVVENTRHIAVPTGPDYHLEKDIADRAIGWMASHHAAAPDKPFFIYFATGTAHAPNHAPKEWLERFRGKFDLGWDRLRAEIFARQKALGVIPKGTADAPRPDSLPRWDSLSVEKRQLYARYMEAYAASLSYADSQIGRLIQHLKDTGEFDNTVIIYIQGDNGASAEGSFDGKLFEQSALFGLTENIDHALARKDDIGTAAAYNLMPGGWGWAMNAPFRWAKRYASHFGGTRNAMAISWPREIGKKERGLRPQFHHVSDIMPTILDVAGVTAPKQVSGVDQQPITGISMRYSFKQATAPSHRTKQIFAMAQNLSLYEDGWVAATTPMLTPWEKSRPAPVPLAGRDWELYNINKDFSESRNLATRYPAKLEEMKTRYWAEAAKGNILPIHQSEGNHQGRPDLNTDRKVFVYKDRVASIPETAAPDIVGRAYSIAAVIDVPEGGADGVLVAQGGRYGGYSLFLDKGRPSFTHNLTPALTTRLTGADVVSPGEHKLLLGFRPDDAKAGSGGTLTLTVDGHEVARDKVGRTFPLIVSHTEGFDIGQDMISPVDPSYTVEKSAFTGIIRSITVTLD